MTWFFDTHIHLSDPLYTPYIKSILSSMTRLHIKACCVSTDLTTSEATVRLAEKNNNIISFVGIHPEFTNVELEDIKEFVLNHIKEIHGIGEIGLDGTFKGGVTKEQKNLFTKQLEMAEKSNLPVSIHSRKALDEVVDILKSYNTRKTLIHWFDGNSKQLRVIMDMGCFVSFGPVMIYANDKQTLLAKSNEEQVLVETDGPVRFSRCFEGKVADITFIPSVIHCASKILKKNFEDMTLLLEKNSKTYLDINNI
ncbi:MAG: TatD family hydrolase [Candidatus Nitrosoabyssus spongiisocia]|nr:MAG: TatD family hydrolase [Nitrosopumilaceae archaeon AB1(1)]